MDVSNLMNILALARNDNDKSKVSLLLDELFPGENRSVPDPYFGGIDGFNEVYQMIDQAAATYLNKLK
jgi:protein-tyrosine phosphatase